MTPKQREALLFLAQHLFYGVAAAITFGGLVLATDLGRIRTLLATADHPWVIVSMLFFGLIITFGGVAMAVGIMGLARDDGE